MFLEQFKYSPEIIRDKRSIHTDGGYGAETWQAIFDDATSSRVHLPPRMMTYGHSVIKGEIDDRAFAHRQYLSRFDWLRLSGVLDKSLITDKKTIRRHPKIEIPTMVDVKVYATLEAERAYTVHDYVREKWNRLSNYHTEDINPKPAILWSGDNSRWMSHASADSSNVHELSLEEKSQLQTAFLRDTSINEETLQTSPEILIEDVLSRTLRDPNKIAAALKKHVPLWDMISVNLIGLRTPASASVAEQLQKDYADHFDGVKPHVDWKMGQFFFRPSADFPVNKNFIPQIKGDYEKSNELPERFRPTLLATV